LNKDNDEFMKTENVKFISTSRNSINNCYDLW